MNFYVVYDKDDNLVAYIDSLEELCSFVNRPINYLRFHLKDTDLFYIQKPKLLKIYKFFSEVC